MTTILSSSLPPRSRTRPSPDHATTLHQIDLDNYKSSTRNDPYGKKASALRSRIRQNFYLLPPGKSPEADAIYKKYLEIYNDINKKIYEIDQIVPPTEIIKIDRPKILEQQAKLGTIYLTDYNNDKAREQDFEDHTKQLVITVDALYKEAMGQDTIHSKILLDSLKAQNIATDATGILTQDQNIFNSVQTLNDTITSLQAKIEKLDPKDPKRLQAQKDLDATKTALSFLINTITAAQPTFLELNTELAAIKAQGGILEQLERLVEIADPQQDDLTQANALLTTVQTLQSSLDLFEKGDMALVNINLSSVTQGIARVQADLQPAPVPGKIENGCWYIDWTTHDTPIPQGVNTINIFVGKLELIDGLPAIGGFGDIDLPKLKDFVQRCQNNQPPIPVKVSIGGGVSPDPSYQYCWDLLNPNNVEPFAKLLVQFCHDYGLTGIDFDYEEFPGPTALVGQLIQTFKAEDPKLQATLCANAGHPYWFNLIKPLLDAAIDPKTGKCGVDRLYVMAYTDPLEQEKTYLIGWIKSMKELYGFDPSQIVFGIDDFDEHAYDIGDAAKCAKELGISTCYWAWNPATKDASNASAMKIWTNYNPPAVTPLQAVLFFIALFLGPLALLCGLIYLALSNNDKKPLSAPVAMKSAPLPEPSAPPLDLMNPNDPYGEPQTDTEKQMAAFLHLHINFS